MHKVNSLLSIKEYSPNTARIGNDGIVHSFLDQIKQNQQITAVSKITKNKVSIIHILEIGEL